MDDVIEEIVNSRTVDACVYEKVDDFNFFSELNVIIPASVTILSLNIRSCNKHFDELLVILNSYHKKFDIIVLTETWMDESSALVSMDGYEMFVNKVSKNQNDGVIVFVSNCMVASCVDVSLHGATCLELQLMLGSERLSLLAVYRSPSGDLCRFIEELESYLEERCRGKAAWLIGDFNCCILPETRHLLSQRYLDTLYGAGFTSCINIPTRATGLTNSCIDHIFTNITDVSSIKSAIIKSEMTDHYFTVVQFQPCKNYNLNKAIDTVHHTHFDLVAASRLLSGWDWAEVINTDDVNLSCSVFIEQLQNIVSLSTKSYHCTAKSSRIKPWMTAGLLRSIRTRDRMGRRLKAQPFNVTLKSRYKTTEIF